MKPQKSWETFGKHARLPQGQETHGEMSSMLSSASEEISNVVTEAEETDPVELRRLSLWIILDRTPVTFRRLPHGSDLLWNRSDVFHCLPVGAAFSFCCSSCLSVLSDIPPPRTGTIFHQHFLPPEIFILCHTSWRRCRKAWNQASSATLGNFIKTECLFCPWILCLAAASHLCWESCSEKQN